MNIGDNCLNDDCSSTTIRRYKWAGSRSGRPTAFSFMTLYRWLNREILAIMRMQPSWKPRGIYRVSNSSIFGATLVRKLLSRLYRYATGIPSCALRCAEIYRETLWWISNDNCITKSFFSLYSKIRSMFREYPKLYFVKNCNG